MATKVVLTNGHELDSKYGGQAADVWDAVDDLIAADRGRGINTLLVKLDDQAGPAGASAVTAAADWTQAKAAVDAVNAALSPDYLMLLGGPDLVPHCELDNAAQDDDGPFVPSDLPYACDMPASSAIQDYLTPTRVISRLPDVPVTNDPEMLLRALEFAAGWQSRDHDDYDGYLGISAEVWDGSTRLTLTQLFGDHADMQVSPDDGPGWSDDLLSRRSHFINLHGAPTSPQYVGERTNGDFPVGHDAALVDGRVAEGTVVAAECCYGAQLYEPLDDQLGMPFVYLRSGAYGFFGSTTIAWGMPASTAWADVLCRLFHASLLAGASVGRAGLEARQNYIATSSPMDPLDLKTIAQFLILGDPSSHPVAAAPAAPAVAPDAAAKSTLGLSARRTMLFRKGLALGRATAWAEPIDGPPSEPIVEALKALAGVPGAGEPRIASFEVRGGAEPKGLMLAFTEAPPSPAKMHLLVQTLELPNAPIRQQVAVVAVEESGQLTSVKTGLSR